MGRHAEGWSLEWRRGIGYVRFTHAKHQHLISTGKRDPREATEEAARLYARVIAGGAARPASVKTLVAAPLDVLLAEWISSLRGVLDPETLKTYETTYAGKHWLTHYSTLEEMCSELARERYRSARLKAATAKTVKKETWAQDKFLAWCERTRLIAAVPRRLKWDKRTVGTRTGKQREVARELSTEQVVAFIRALPEWFETGPRAFEKKPYPIRDRFVFAYETSLRPATVSALVWEDWREETGRLRIRASDDKIRFGREVPLSAVAQAALVRVRDAYAARGLKTEPTSPIFGKHLYRKTFARAARVSGVGGVVAPYDLRHGRATHLADDGGSLTGIGYLLGHKQASTTSRYLHGSVRAAEDALSRSGTLLDADSCDSLRSGAEAESNQLLGIVDGTTDCGSRCRGFKPRRSPHLDEEAIRSGSAPDLERTTGSDDQTVSEFVRDRVREALGTALAGDEEATLRPLARAAAVVVSGDVRSGGVA